jgi:dTDP-4-amino-4,6-dideoxygalactose transaminase
MSAYSKFERSDLTNSENIGKVSLGLPFWIDMKDEDWKNVENAFLNFSTI